MKKTIIILILFLSFTSHSQNKPKYPNPKEGFKRVDLLLPKIENEKNYKVEVKFSMESKVIECANVDFSFNLKNLKTEYGIPNSYRFPYYSLENDAVEITEGLDSDCKTTKTILKKIYSSQNILIEYQSYYARPFYIPESWNLEYRLWKADDYYKSAMNSENPEENAPKVEFSSYDFGESEFPKQKREVNDFEFVFSVEELEKLTRIIREFEKKTSNRIAIVSIKSIKSYDDFDKYAIDLSNNWGVGQKGKENGLTIVFSKTLRKIRISTGTETQKILSDSFCKSVIDKTMIPEFKNGNYYEGIEKGLSQLISEWK